LDADAYWGRLPTKDVDGTLFLRALNHCCCEEFFHWKFYYNATPKAPKPPKREYGEATRTQTLNPPAFTHYSPESSASETSRPSLNPSRQTREDGCYAYDE
jgi:hypothetical protein